MTNEDDFGVPIIGNAKALKLTDQNSLRSWWHMVLRGYGRFPCYAIFLILQSDKNIINYLKKQGQELHLISGKNCLILVLSEQEFRFTEFAENKWFKLISEQAKEGYSLQVAQLFGVELTQFPCLLIFDDIRSKKCVTISMAGLDRYKTNKKMRTVFSIIKKATSDKKNPVDLLVDEKFGEIVRERGQVATQKFARFTEKTFEAIMEALVKAAIK